MHMFKLAIVLTVLFLFTGCTSSGICVRCRSQKLSENLRTPPSGINRVDKPAAIPVVRDSGTSEKSKEDRLAKAINDVGYLVFYVIVASLSAWVLQKTGREDTLLARISASIYDSCSSTKKAILRIVNVLLLDRLFKHKGKQ